MAPTKRHKWVDVYDPVTGHYKPQPEVDDQLPGRDTATKSPAQVQERVKERVKEQDENRNIQQQEEVKVGLWRSRWAPAEMKEEAVSRQQQGGAKQSPQPSVIKPDTDQGYFSKDGSSPALSGAHDGEGEGEIGGERAHDNSQHQSVEAVSQALTTTDTTDTCRQTEPRHLVEQVGDTGVNYRHLGLPIVDDSNQQHATYQRDFRNEAPLEIWTEEDWSATHLDKNYYKQSSDTDSLASIIYEGISTYLERYVKHWVQTTHEIVVDKFPDGIADADQCDIHPEHGTFMEPVFYPPTNLASDLVKGLNDTAQIRIDRRMREIAEQEELEVRKLQAAKTEVDKKPQKDKQPGAAEGAEVGEKPENGVERKKARRRERAGSREIRIASHLRAARLEDMEQIAAIYNREVASSFKLPDKRSVGPDKFTQIYHGCCAHNLPFIVVIEGWNDKEIDLRSKNLRVKGQRVIGFAVMDYAARGIYGSYATHAAPCGKLTVVVHPDFRRKNICSAMLDAVFSCCSTNYKNRRGYEIVNPAKDRRHLNPKHNSREWHFIDIEVILASGSNKEDTEQTEEYKWITHYLKNYFQMELVYHDEKLYRDDRFNHKWLDRLTFRHQCRPLGS
ncbi:hypothetical protein F5Y13DRAFT_184892 [Hypoxylon sp. FL1857]|nr:hypothetical protein F5Y13DRAFT_184892 [Hypoxylon sp. FL1857]